jgi:hypothetical protein
MVLGVPLEHEWLVPNLHGLLPKYNFIERPLATDCWWAYHGAMLPPAQGQ